MNQTVEKGKTLLVDGPASVMVTSGNVEVFGAQIGKTRRVLIREGKRLPFVVEETATFEISLGENANVEDIEGNTIPDSWVKSYEEFSSLESRPAVAMVLGTIDVGKSSFCTYLLNRLLTQKRKVAILDGDLGQSDIGPPCTVAHTLVSKPITDLFNLETKNAFFVGVTSPSTVVSKVIEGLVSLKEEIIGLNPDFVVINTDGWIEGEDAVNYKAQLVEKLNPDLIFCIQQKDEMEPLLNALKTHNKTVVESPSATRQRSREKRRSLRELGYMKYLRNAKVQSIPLSWLKVEEDELLGLSRPLENFGKARKVYDLLGMKPLHVAEFHDKILTIIGKSRWIASENLDRVESFTKKKVVIIRKGEEDGLILALYDAGRRFLGVGVLREIHYQKKIMKILTPVSEGISIVAMGKVKLDKNFKEIPAFADEEQLGSLSI